MECYVDADGSRRRRSCAVDILAGRNPFALTCPGDRGCRPPDVRKIWTV